MTPDVFSILFADADSRALFGSSPMRVYAHDEVPQGVVRPYAAWSMISGVPANYLGQLPDMDDARVQIDVYADTQATAKTAAEAIRDAIEPYAHMVGSASRPRDSTTRSFGFMLDFEFFTSR